MSEKMSGRKKAWEIFKAAGESFSTVAGVVAVGFTILTVFVPLSLMVTIPITGVIGLMCGAAGAYSKYQDIQKKEKKEEELRQKREEEKRKSEIIVETEKKLLDITNELETDLKGIKNDLIRHHVEPLGRSISIHRSHKPRSRLSQTLFSNGHKKRELNVLRACNDPQVSTEKSFISEVKPAV